MCKGGIVLDWNRIVSLTELLGAPGSEEDVRMRFREALEPHVEQVWTDRLGGIVGLKAGRNKKDGYSRGPRILVISHLDEVALLITGVTHEGFLKFQTLGGWDSSVLQAQRFVVKPRKGGDPLLAVIGSVPPHLSTGSSVPLLTDLFLDVGAASAAEVAVWGIGIGDVAVPDSSCALLGKGSRFVAKAWDNRLGCGLVLELASSLPNGHHPNELYVGATVQEEVGLRGAYVMTQLVRPDLVLAIDVGPAGDTPSSQDRGQKLGELGKGAVIRLFDRATITPPRLRDFLLTTAEEVGIPHQVFYSSGATDAGMAHRVGVGSPASTLGVAGRYIHSHGSVVDRSDVEAAVALLREIILRLDRSVFNSILPSS
ncbi:M42 family metallopeptidase [Pasteuria penetrans]|uniref:M42 family metallopeptidase n=1 Tax=Pasteuria penetrans TaxID=86005 RepID=UPI000F9A05FD|nr:M42 family metallopeptidase [Pasteuria penetrans]